MYHLDIIEKDYFGLRFMDSAQVPVRGASVTSDKMAMNMSGHDVKA